MKICERNYSTGSLLATKLARGVETCPQCEKPAICHGKTVKERVMFWALIGNTGTSSKTIAMHMVGTGYKDWFSWPPMDSGDRARCIKLLELVPEWITRLPEMVQYDGKSDPGIVINSSGINLDTNTWSRQIPMIIKEGNL
jgi:hypothetical protein